MLPLRPHLYWGGTTCPGSKWPLWVPQLQAKAKEEGEMTPEQMAELKRHIDAKIEAARPLLTADKKYIEDQKEAVIRRVSDVMQAGIQSGGAGPTPDEIKEAAKDALREGTG